MEEVGLDEGELNVTCTLREEVSSEQLVMVDDTFQENLGLIDLRQRLLACVPLLRCGGGNNGGDGDDDEQRRLFVLPG
jgi:hypothetical protein